MDGLCKRSTLAGFIACLGASRVVACNDLALHGTRDGGVAALSRSAFWLLPPLALSLLPPVLPVRSWARCRQAHLGSGLTFYTDVGMTFRVFLPGFLPLCSRTCLANMLVISR